MLNGIVPGAGYSGILKASKNFLVKSMRSTNVLKLICPLILLISGLPGYTADFHGDVIYQIFTDRFCNGDPSNDDPEVSKGMFDGTKKNWHEYWGGDLAGVRKQLPYIKEMGFTAVWISPVIDNVNKPTIDGKGVKFAPYHGYHARDFRAIDEHIGDWKEFDQLVKEAHKLGIKVMVDMPLNHTSTINHGEFGALYSGTEFMSDTENDRNKYFHHLPLITEWNDPYQLQYYTLMWLGDLNQESSYVHTYLNDAVLKLQAHGADGTRLDAAKHTNWGWQHTVINKLHNKGEHFVVAEWWMSDTKDPIYKEGVKFANKSGSGMFDFPFATAVRKTLGSKKGGSFKYLADTISKENQDFLDCNGLVTFIDNHDMPRFLSLYDNKDNLHLAIGLMFMSRGIPSFYYGTEQYLHNDTKNGEDPYTRVWMSNFDKDSDCFKLVKSLNKLRTNSSVLRFGKQETVYVDDDIYVFRRTFGKKVAVVAVSKNKSKSRSVTLKDSGLEQGKYSDSLGSKLNGADIEIKSGGTRVEIPANSISIWMNAASSQDPSISSIMPRVINSGVPVKVYGEGFGSSKGEVLLGGKSISVSHWSDNRIVFDTPQSILGKAELVVKSKSGGTSNPSSFTVFKKKLVPITIQVKGAPINIKKEKLYITGNGASLGEWKKDSMECAGPMLYSEDRDYILCVPLPASTKVKFELFAKDEKGNLVKGKSSKHEIKVQDSGPWRHLVNWGK